LLILTGARVGEVLSAEWAHFDLVRGVWTKPSHHTKQKRIEHVPLNRVARGLISSMWKQRASEQYLFPGKKGARKKLDRPWKAITATAGLSQVRLHDLRHSFASHLVSAGVSLYTVGKLLGHTKSQTTERYAHVNDDALREASNQFGKLLTTGS
jgi:integrase